MTHKMTCTDMYKRDAVLCHAKLSCHSNTLISNHPPPLFPLLFPLFLLTEHLTIIVRRLIPCSPYMCVRELEYVSVGD